MKKFSLIIFFTLFTNVCFAEDLFTISENGFSKFIRTESIEASVIAKAENESLFEMTYTLISIPDQATLDKMRLETQDNKISFKKQTFTFKCSFNTITNEWSQDGTLWLKSDEYWARVPEKRLYEFQGYMPAGPYYGDTPEAVSNRKAVIAAYSYVLKHNLLKYY